MTEKKPTSLWRAFLFPFVNDQTDDREAWTQVRSRGRFLFIRTLSYVVLGMVFMFLMGLIFPAFSSRTLMGLVISLAPIGFIYAIAQWNAYERRYMGSE